MLDGAATIRDERSGTRLSLAVRGYAHPEAAPDGDAWGAASELDVALEVEMGERTWPTSGPLLCSGDLAALTGWLRLVAAGRLADPYEPVRMGLGLSGRRHGETVLLRLRLSHDLAPPFVSEDDSESPEGPALRFRVAPERVLDLAGLLEAWQARFPPR